MSPERIYKSPERIYKHFLSITSVNFHIFTNFLKQRMNQHSSFDSSKSVMTKCFCSKINFKNFVEVIKKLLIRQFILLTRHLRSVYARSPWINCSRTLTFYYYFLNIIPPYHMYQCCFPKNNCQYYVKNICMHQYSFWGSRERETEFQFWP